MSYENLNRGGFDVLRATDVEGCFAVDVRTLAPRDPHPEWIGHALLQARAELGRAGLIELLDADEIFLAGGAVLRLVSDGKVGDGKVGDGDLDICPRDGRALARTTRALVLAGYEIERPVKDHVQTWTYGADGILARPRVQVVTYDHFPTVESAIGRHDLHVCQWAVTSRGVLCTEEAYRDARDRTLHVNHVAFPMDLLRRLSKYAGRGYRVTPQALDALYGALSKAGPVTAMTRAVEGRDVAVYDEAMKLMYGEDNDA